MKSISLIGYTSDKGVIKYYSKIQHLNDKKLNDYVPCQITPYSVLLQDDDDENVHHLVDGFFEVSSNNPDAIVFCDFYLEFLWKHIPFPGPVVISRFQSLLKRLKNYGERKWLVLCLSITKNIQILLEELTAQSITFSLLSEIDRTGIKKSLGVNDDSELREFYEQHLGIFSRLSKLTQYGVGGIIVDSEVLYLYIRRVDLSVPIIYTMDVHIETIIDFIHNKEHG